MTTIANLPARGNLMGLDGLGYDPIHQRILIPDSPHGTLLTLRANAGNPVELAHGLGRDVGVAIGPDESIYIASEATNGLLRIPANGGPGSPIPGISEADDVITIGSLLYVTLIADGQVVAVDPSTGHKRVLVANSLTGTIAILRPCGS
ncbi:MAG: NHL repeat-containing protein [Actinomycetota bacterium]